METDRTITGKSQTKLSSKTSSAFMTPLWISPRYKSSHPKRLITACHVANQISVSQSCPRSQMKAQRKCSWWGALITLCPTLCTSFIIRRCSRAAMAGRRIRCRGRRETPCPRGKSSPSGSRCLGSLKQTKSARMRSKIRDWANQLASDHTISAVRSTSKHLSENLKLSTSP